MLEDIIKHNRSEQANYKFSLLIPTWNNVGFLKNCISSIKKNSFYNVQIIVIVNEGIDGTIEWLESEQGIDYIHSKTNIGICYALNIARPLLKADYIVYVNDDMYLLPNWDLEIDKEIEKIGDKKFMLSSTMIEPEDTGNPCVIVRDYGRNLENFNEERLLKEYSDLPIPDWNGSTWPPCILPVDLWDLVGGMSIEFSPGMYSDPDFSRKLVEAGVRYFKGVGNSLVYHFGKKSTKRVKQNNGKKLFLQKWGITSRTFMKEYLKIGTTFSGEISIPRLSFTTKFINKIKRIKN